jgi:trimeric autotransporter adhesin
MRCSSGLALDLPAGAVEAPRSRVCGRPRRLLLGALVGAAAALACVAPTTTHGGPAVRTTRSREGIESLPAAVRGSVSASLGAHEPGYRVLGLRAINPAQHLHVAFSRRGVTVESGRARIAMALSSYGYAGALRSLVTVAPQARANRVSYGYGPLEERFANGPLGLEQSFDLTARPGARRGSGPLTFSLALSGDLRPRLQHGSLLLRGDGVSLRYGGLIATDARGRALHSWLQILPGRLLIRIDDRGASYPLRIDPFVQQAEMTAAHGTRGEELGESVAVSGNTIVVGTPNYAHASSGVEQGAAYVFTKPASGWADATQAAVLTARRGQPEELFGHSVSVSGSTIVVGAPFREVGRHTGQGAAYVFVRPAGGWRDATQTAMLIAGNGLAHEFFGEAVAVSGNVVVCGAPSRSVGGDARRGAVEVFRRPARGWRGVVTQSAQLTASDGRANDALGISVALSGNTIVAGADLRSVDSHPGEGAAYVFVERPSGWHDATQSAELNEAEGGPGELFGHAVALSGETVVVGAPYHRVGAVAGQGAVDVFVKPASGWAGSVGQAAVLTASDGVKNELLGRSIAISGDTIVAGASSREVAANPEQGEVYVFVKPASGWTNAAPLDTLSASEGADGDSLGRSVALSGDTVVAGAPDHEVRRSLAQGAAYVFVVRSQPAQARMLH